MQRRMAKACLRKTKQQPDKTIQPYRASQPKSEPNGVQLPGEARHAPAGKQIFPGKNDNQNRQNGKLEAFEFMQMKACPPQKPGKETQQGIRPAGSPDQPCMLRHPPFVEYPCRQCGKKDEGHGKEGKTNPRDELGIDHQQPAGIHRQMPKVVAKKIAAEKLPPAGMVGPKGAIPMDRCKFQLKCIYCNQQYGQRPHAQMKNKPFSIQ